MQGRLDALLRDAPPADGRILAVIADRRRDYDREHGGDPDRGAAVFASKTTTLSPMPANFADALDPADLRHLMAYLLTRRPPDALRSGN